MHQSRYPTMGMAPTASHVLELADDVPSDERATVERFASEMEALKSTEAQAHEQSSALRITTRLPEDTVLVHCQVHWNEDSAIKNRYCWRSLEQVARWMTTLSSEAAIVCGWTNPSVIIIMCSRSQLPDPCREDGALPSDGGTLFPNLSDAYGIYMKWSLKDVEPLSPRRDTPLKKLLLFHFCTRLLDSRWVHAGAFNQMISTFSLEHSVKTRDEQTPESLTAAFRVAKVENVSVGMITDDDTLPSGLYCQYSVTILPSIYRFYPCQAPRQNCVILPGLTKASCHGFVETGANKLAGWDVLKDYWRVVHGYNLPESALTNFLQVEFWGGNRLTYPAGCVWSRKWMPQPHMARHRHEVLLSKIISDIMRDGRCLGFRMSVRNLGKSGIDTAPLLMTPLHVPEPNPIQISADCAKRFHDTQRTLSTIEGSPTGSPNSISASPAASEFDHLINAPQARLNAQKAQRIATRAAQNELEDDTCPVRNLISTLGNGSSPVQNHLMSNQHPNSRQNSFAPQNNQNGPINPPHNFAQQQNNFMPQNSVQQQQNGVNQPNFVSCPFFTTE